MRYSTPSVTTGTGKRAKRLEWAIEKHRDIAEDDLDKLQQDYEHVLRQSKEAHERKI